MPKRPMLRTRKRRMIGAASASMLLIGALTACQDDTVQGSAGAAETPGNTASTTTSTSTGPSTTDTALPTIGAPAPTPTSRRTTPSSRTPSRTGATTDVTAHPTTLTVETTRDDGIAECLFDTWTLSNPVFGSAIEDAVGGIGMDLVSGSATITFNHDLTFKTVYDKWTHEVTVPNQSDKIVVVRNGVDSGTFTGSADGSSITMKEASMGSKVTMTLQGMQIQSPATKPETNTVIYDCVPGDDLMTMTSDDGVTIVLGRGSLPAVTRTGG